MIRLTTLCAAALVLSSAAGLAQETKRAGEAVATQHRNDANEQGLPSIADEAAEVGQYGSEQDGMSKAMAETEGAEADDTCIRADGEVGCELVD
ncbi:hypothetical protein RDV64_02095 [Acuticoccus sp. MNP-M23]|uniref:hypothetical protein n=1 Tax=Acuticoccus sp. MNP-M23 TaxID=3072793 RepID=UPI002815D9A7|nr:hypothetical protein [Acuticoccus sp. MNP-M23]WMS43218.1 hypothetical protein RDV64_02095 [Acuticoccus sp. MNP-M23]